MPAEDIIGLMIPITYALLLTFEAFNSGRQFPAVRGWRLSGGFCVAVLLGINATAPSWLPGGWLARHRLLEGARLGWLWGAVVGYLAVSLAQYGLHRAEHRLAPLWQGLHQLHHAPVRMDLSGSAFTHPLEVVVSAVLFTLVTAFVLGLDRLAIAITGYIGAFYSMFQHVNVRTPRWLGYIIERPESHCLHHERGIHARNYSDLPLWDMVFGTFANPASFSGAVGFEPERSRKTLAMLAWVDVNQDTFSSRAKDSGA